MKIINRYNAKYCSMKYLAFFFFLIPSYVSSQDVNDDLLFYGDIMVNASEPQHRERAAKEFNRLFDQSIEGLSGIKDCSDNKYVSQLYAPDSSFSIITWQVELAEHNFAYSGYFFSEGGAPVKMEDNVTFDKNIQYDLHEPDYWYGALYYNLLEISPDDYLIFGYNAHGEFENGKVVDALTVKNGELLLGKEIFQDKTDTTLFLSKVSLSYSADASVNLNYNPGLEMIVHDHLQNRMGRLPNQGPTNVPDGTYEGYKLEDGIWKYKEKLFHHSYGENNAPRPKPVLNKRKEGRQKK